MKRIHLIDTGVFETGAAVIVSCPSGISYANQVGGMACMHPAYEGALIPTMNVDLPHDDKPQGDCGCWGYPITHNYADRCDQLFIANALPFRVDRERLQESTECWIPVTVKTKAKGWEDFVGMQGIYTTADNCD